MSYTTCTMRAHYILQITRDQYISLFLPFIHMSCFKLKWLKSLENYLPFLKFALLSGFIKCFLLQQYFFLGVLEVVVSMVIIGKNSHEGLTNLRNVGNGSRFFCFICLKYLLQASTTGYRFIRWVALNPETSKQCKGKELFWIFKTIVTMWILVIDL